MCESYVEPFLFLFCIGIAVLLNSGTNIIFGSVSNMTSSISAILQLALSMDYSIMLINRYKQEKENTSDKVQAMKDALYKSFASISSSSLTTIVGLIVLIFMSFTIGRDLGLVLAKGVLLSLLVIFTCLPALILIFDNLIVKTKKKAPNITLNRLGTFAYKLRGIGFIALMVCFIGSYVLKGNLQLEYTASEQDQIAEVFPENNQMAIIYKSKDEKKVANYLKQIESHKKVDEVLAYGNTIGEGLKYNEFNNKLKDLEVDTEIDEYLLKILYYKYYNEDEKNKMTFDEFVKFTKNNVLDNKDFSSKIEKDTKSNVNKLEKFTSSKEINKKRTYSEIANILDMNKKDCYNLFVYYYSDKINIKLTVNEFINFMNKDVLTDSDYSGSISSSAKKDLKTISKFMDKKLLNKNMTSKEMAKLFGMDKSKIDDLYLYYYSKNGTNNKMTLNQFANYILKDVMSNKKYSKMFDKKTVESMKLLQTMSNTNLINKELPSKQIAGMFGINEQMVNQIILLNSSMSGKQTNKISPYKFVTFILNNKQVSSNLSKENLTQLKTAYGIMNSSNKNISYNYNEMARFIGVNKSTTRQVYALYASKYTSFKLTPIKFVDFILKNKNDSTLSKNLDKSTIKSLELVDEIMDSVISGKKYNSKEIAKLFSLNKDDAKLLYSLYYTKYKNTNPRVSLKSFIGFTISDVITNKKYSDKFDNGKITKLKTIKQIMNESLQNKAYNSSEIFKLISKLTDSIDKDTVDILYIYYGSENNYNKNWNLSIEQLMNYVNDNILKDSRFDDFIDDEMRKEVKDSKKDIQDNKEKLVGDNYSRVIMNTKFDLEGTETNEFLQKIYDDLNGAEFYVIGDSPMAYEISKTFGDEFNFISILTMIAIFIVVAVTFKSIGIPFMLVLIIQCAVYMTMGILSLLGGSIYFIALLIVQSILMGATIDYAILYASYYKESRETLNVEESVKNAYNNSIHTILTSSSILIFATFIVGKFSEAIVSKICMTLSKGVLCSTILILLVLPEVLALFDRFIIRKKAK